MPRFGRIHTPDERDKHFPMRLVLDPLRALAFPRGVPEGRRSYRRCPIMDQGNTGTCVAHGWSAKIEGGPVIQNMPVGPYDFYREIVKEDEYEDNDFEATAPVDQLQFGTSVRAGAKAAQKRGLLKNYLWAKSVEDARAWMLIGKGGLVIGINWKSEMMDTDTDGFIRYRGSVEGGHCVATWLWDDLMKHNGRTEHVVGIQQSWGLPWGFEGRGIAYMTEDDFQKAIEDDGEVCAATELRVKPLNTSDGVPGPVLESSVSLNIEKQR